MLTVADECQCPKCGRLHRTLGNPPWLEAVKEIAERIKPTICETYNSRGGQTIEGRILVDDFNTLMSLVGIRPH